MSSSRRVVSLLPAATEMVCVLGAGGALVGRSHECDFPEEIRRLPVVTSTPLDAAASAAEIHQQVAALRSDGASSLFTLDDKLLQALKADLIITQGQCAVCAISEADVAAAIRGLQPQPEVLTLSPLRFADLWTDLQRVARALGVRDEGRAAIAALKSRVVDVIQRAAEATARPTVACLEWLDPLMGGGNWIPELVELAGGQPMLARAGEHSSVVSFESLASANPEIIVAMPCGLDLARARRDLESLIQRPDWSRLRAVQQGKLFATDGSAYFNRPGPRLVDSLEILAEILQASSNPTDSTAARLRGSARLPSARPDSGPPRFHRVQQSKSSEAE